MVGPIPRFRNVHYPTGTGLPSTGCFTGGVEWGNGRLGTSDKGVAERARDIVACPDLHRRNLTARDLY